MLKAENSFIQVYKCQAAVDAENQRSRSCCAQRGHTCFVTPLLPPSRYRPLPAHAEFRFDPVVCELEVGQQFELGECRSRDRQQR